MFPSLKINWTTCCCRSLGFSRCFCFFASRKSLQTRPTVKLLNKNIASFNDLALMRFFLPARLFAPPQRRRTQAGDLAIKVLEKPFNDDFSLFVSHPTTCFLLRRQFHSPRFLFRWFAYARRRQRLALSFFWVIVVLMFELFPKQYLLPPKAFLWM